MFRDYWSSMSDDAFELRAAEHIDVLTQYKIRDFKCLTDFQKHILFTVHEKLTQFERENEDVLDTPLASYSVNGVSMSFGEKIKIVSGIAVPADIYAMLRSTGLCYPVV